MRGDTAIGHVDAHNELRAGILREAERFGVSVDLGGPYKIGDPGHIQEHNKTRAAIDTIAKVAGITVVLPEVHKLGDTGHAPHDHDQLDQALALISAAAAWNDATGGSISTFTSGTALMRRHTFTSSGSFVVARAVRPFTLFAVGGGGGGGGGGVADIGYGGLSGASGGAFNKPGVTLTVISVPVTVGGGGTGSPWYGAGTKGGNSSFGAFLTCGGGGGGNFASPPESAWHGQPTPGNAGSEGGTSTGGTGGGGQTATTNPAPAVLSAKGLPTGIGGGGGGTGQDSGGAPGGPGAVGIVVIDYQIGVTP